MSDSHPARLALGLLAIVLLAGGCGATQREPGTQGDAGQGRALWAQSACVGCHGLNAEGGTGGPALANTPLTIREVTDIVRRGGPGMPKYPASQISDQDLRDMYAWFRNPVPAATGELEQDPWVQAGCGGCHGPDAGGASAVALAGAEIAYDEFQRVVRGGAEGMPAYSASQISDQALQAIYAWLQAQGPVPAATTELEQDPWVQAGCGGCHGPDAGGASAAALAGAEIAYDEFQRMVRGGAEGMPAYSASQISDQALQAIYAWLQAQAPPPAATAGAEQDLWVQAGCGGCHGPDAGGASAAALAGAEIAYDEFQRVVRGGAEGMPAYTTGQISDADLRRMYDWLMALP